MPTLPINPSLSPERPRPLWARAVVLAAIWTLVLQPAVSSAQLAQSPMFTVTSAPPNVMLMFDDSSSMNRLDLNPPPAYANPVNALGRTPSTTGNPALNLNTVGYFGISGVRWHSAQPGAPAWFLPGNSAYDGRWTFSRTEVLTRSPAFNPLAYNPAVQYLPWNNNGTRFPNAAIGGLTNVPNLAHTEWDPRNLPPSMGGGPVAAKLTVPNQGVINRAGVTKSWAAPTAGSVTYVGLPDGTNAPSGVDLFDSTIAFDNPNCAGFTTPTNYSWYCPAGTGTPFSSPADVCNSGNVGMPSATRTCCNAIVNSPTSAPAVGTVFGYFPNPPLGPPPSMSGPSSEVCTSITYTGTTGTTTGPPCTTVDPPPLEVVCGTFGTPASGEVCYYDPPPVTTCTTYTTYRWRCDYPYTLVTNNYSCPTATPQFCQGTPGTPTCTGGLQPLTPTSDARYVSGYWTPARYAIYDGPAARTSTDISELSNYRMIMVDRKFGWNGATQVPSGTNPSNAVGKYYVVDGVTGQPAPPTVRPDCPQVDAFGPWCTWAQEAQNYANWYTYYRSRLFAAIAVMSEVTSGLIGPEQFMRMGYGRINYFPNSRNPWNVLNVNDRLPNSLPAVDGATNEGGVERGVRPFTVYNPPLSATLNPDRQAVFNWLFTVNGLGPTPNREAMHGAGLYFTRSDSQGPWGNVPGVGGGEPASAHLWCRRNYTLLATDGEWTRLDPGQTLLEKPPLIGTRSPAGGPGSVSVSMSINGPAITGVDRDNPLVTLNYQYLVASEPQISGGSGSTQTETLTDVLHYYWAHDLRATGPSGLQNSLKPTPRNRAFWQHMSSYIVGYGVVASMDDPAAATPLRTLFDAGNTIAWPQVGDEPCRQLDDNADDAVLNGGTCSYTVAPSGNRINDTLRGGLTSGGDFFSATSPAALKSSLQAVFAAIGADNAAGTSPALSSSTVGAGNLIIQSGFFTNTWDGYVRAFDQQALLTFLTSGGVAPAPVWTINFDVPTNRPIFSSTAINTPIAFNWTSLTAPQQTALDPPNVGQPSSPIFDYLRGDQSKELRFPGGIFRNRTTTILGDVVGSTPLYSKGADHGYARKPAASIGATQGAPLYPAYVVGKRTTRTPVAIFGANDGMLHVLDARVGQATSGREIFAFVPRSQYFTLDNLASPAYAHRFYVDGPVIESDIYNGTVWKTIAIGTTGAGPAGIFALDITSPQGGFTSSNVLWDIVPSEHSDPVVVSDLGNVLQPGIIGSLKDLSAPNGAGRWVYITGNGYDSVSKQATLFVFDAFTGALIKSLQTGVGSAMTPNGLGGVTPVFDGSRNIIAVYGGDKLGNMWKFDFSSPYINDPDGGGPKIGWEIYNKILGAPKPLFTATDTLGVAQPITAAPRITPHGISGLHIGFGTGKLFEAGDQISTQEQAIYVVWDKGQIPTISKPSLKQIRLQDAPWDHDSNPMTADVADGTFRQFNAADLAAYDWTQEGFYVPLKLQAGPLEGERVLSAGFLDAGVLSFTSFQQQSAGTDLCTPGGTSHVYRFNLIGGLGQAGFLGVNGPVVGRRIQPGLVSAAPPVYEPVPPVGMTIDSMTAAQAQTMLKNPKYKQQPSGRAQQITATGTCAHIGLKVDGTMARIPTTCAGLMPLRTWRPVR